MTTTGRVSVAELTEIRAREPARIRDAWENRCLRPLVRDDGRLLLVAADHPARAALGVRDQPRAMASRVDLLGRLVTALSRPGVDGVLGTPDVLDDLLRLAATAGVELTVAPDADAAAARRAWEAAPFVVVAADAALGCAAAGLRRRSGVALLGDDLDDGSVWETAVHVGAEHVVFLPDAEGWLADRFADAAEGSGREGQLVAVVGGVLAGLAGAALAMPDVTLLPAPPEVPVIDLGTAWPAVLAVAVLCLVLLPAVAALTGLVVARQAHVERVREGA